MKALPQKTHAIIVGVETYKVGENWNLNGPANDACRFVKWLRTKGVPSERTSLFISPLPQNRTLLDDLDVTAEAAEYAAITTALTDTLAEQSGDLLVFYWGGHGVVDAQNRRLLFCADATETNPRHVNLNSILTTWRTNTIGYFTRQIGFVDACQNYLEYMRIASTMPGSILPSGTPVSGVEQYFLLASSVGELAANLSREKSGAFSLVLLEELEKAKAEWPPDMADLNRRLLERFTTMRDAGATDQTPSHLWYRDWNGGEGTIASFTPPMIPAVDQDWSEIFAKSPSASSPDSTATAPSNPVNQPGQPIQVFFSYSHKDEALRDELSAHLASLKRQSVITEWHDRQIPAGDEWKFAIDERINQARVILLLISADFLASDYCSEIEMKRALERHEKCEAIVIPIILRPCYWKGSPFGKLQALPKDARPVTTWPDRDEAFTNVAEGIRRAVERLL